MVLTNISAGASALKSVSRPCEINGNYYVAAGDVDLTSVAVASVDSDMRLHVGWVDDCLALEDVRALDEFDCILRLLLLVLLLLFRALRLASILSL